MDLLTWLNSVQPEAVRANIIPLIGTLHGSRPTVLWFLERREGCGHCIQTNYGMCSGETKVEKERFHNAIL